MADVAIFPMEPTIKSLQSTKESVQVLEMQVRRNQWTTTGSLARAQQSKDKNANISRDRTAGATTWFKLARSVIRDLQAFPEADQQGTVVSRMKRDSPTIEKAQADILGLFDEIVHQQPLKVAND